MRSIVELCEHFGIRSAVQNLPIRTILERHRRLNGRIWIVILQCKVLELKVEDGLDIGVNAHSRQLAWGARELLVDLLKVVEVEVGVACGVDKLTRLEATHLRHHHSEQSVGCDVERNTEEGVGTALVEHTREFAIRHIELKEGVARRQRHLLDIGNIPGRNNYTTRIGIFGNQIHRLLNLVDGLTIGTRPRTPLIAIDVVQVAEPVALNRREDALLCGIPCLAKKSLQLAS